MKRSEHSEYQKMFDESVSYQDMLLEVTLRGGNKAKMNRFLQKYWDANKTWYPSACRKTCRKLMLFVKQGIEAKEVPMKLLWGMLECPKSVEELDAK